MKKLNTYGLKMTGLKKASGETKTLNGYYSGSYIELFYNRESGEIWTIYQYSLGQNTWTVPHDGSIKICNLSEPTTMQQIADKIRSKLELENMIAAADAEHERIGEALLADGWI